MAAAIGQRRGLYRKIGECERKIKIVLVLAPDRTTVQIDEQDRELYT
jgi:hypothetical protein